MEIQHTGDLMFLTFPSPVFVDPTWSRSQNYSIAMVDYSILISPVYRSRPIGWVSRPMITRADVAKFDPNPAGFELFVASISILTGLNSDGQVLEFVDEQINYDRYGQFSADTICIRVMGGESEAERAQLVRKLFEYLMRYIRIETGQWWAGRREVPNTPAIQTTFELARADYYNGRVHSGSAGIFLHDVTVKALGHEIFLAGLSAFKNSGTFDPDKAALSDVILYYAQEDFLLCFLLACNAIEQSRDDLYKAIHKRPSDTDLLKHLSSRLETLVSRNLKTEQPDLYVFAEDLWTARGNMAHGLPFIWKSDRSLTRPPSDFTKKFERLLSWLRQIAR
ncbi:hypothetical protein [Rhizobium laguerreae]|uniref:hypothetical protein n=1 Tax=Rhizobium laguerreae TaxID=1076926 RepID=UPI001C90A2B6|nr:hypothetical protein [Rhizobium laguerreae]MBY3443784.1 hypothetical protein [Rhizobium laguerreae]